MLKLNSWVSMALIHICLLVVGAGLLERLIFDPEGPILPNNVLQFFLVFCGLLAVLGFGGALGLGARVILAIARGTEIKSLRVQVVWTVAYLLCAVVGGAGSVILYFELLSN